jgi:hypothetical protein
VRRKKFSFKGQFADFFMVKSSRTWQLTEVGVEKDVIHNSEIDWRRRV